MTLSKSHPLHQNRRSLPCVGLQNLHELPRKLRERHQQKPHKRFSRCNRQNPTAAGGHHSGMDRERHCAGPDFGARTEHKDRGMRKSAVFACTGKACPEDGLRPKMDLDRRVAMLVKMTRDCFQQGINRLSLDSVWWCPWMPHC